jgi:hypothetical protein
VAGDGESEGNIWAAAQFGGAGEVQIAEVQAGTDVVISGPLGNNGGLSEPRAHPQTPSPRVLSAAAGRMCVFRGGLVGSIPGRVEDRISPLAVLSFFPIRPLSGAPRPGLK